jgi:hypothetical protein
MNIRIDFFPSEAMLDGYAKKNKEFLELVEKVEVAKNSVVQFAAWKSLDDDPDDTTLITRKEGWLALFRMK